MQPARERIHSPDRDDIGVGLSTDYVGLSMSLRVRKLLAKANASAFEKVMFSDLVTKINRKNKRQERALLITSHAIYNLLPPDFVKCKRRIPLEGVSGITLSTASCEFVIHVPAEYDYRLVCARSTQAVAIIDAVSKRLGCDIVVEEVPDAALWEHCMTKDKIKLARKLGGATQWQPNPSRTLAATSPSATTNTAPNSDGTNTSTQRRARRMTGWVSDHTEVTTSDFENLRVIGKGAFGKVMLVKHIATGQLYAMKVMRKDKIIELNQVEHTVAEREILQSIHHPFLVSLHYAFQSTAKLYLVLDYKTGGELFFHLQRSGKFSEDRARFYTAEIALGVGHLHSLGVVYRDLKPENVLLDASGHIALTDFGLAKRAVGQESHTFCGTPEYLAPEIIAKRGHGKAVDWWSLGCMLYEMVVGMPPFYATNTSIMYDLIENGDLRLPSYLSADLSSFLSKLLDRNPDTRLGSGETDVEELFAHPFFCAIDREGLLDNSVPPPFVPAVAGVDDTSNFDEEFTARPAIDSVVPESVLKKLAESEESGAFKDFAFAESDSSGLLAATKAAMRDLGISEAGEQ